MSKRAFFRISAFVLSALAFASPLVAQETRRQVITSENSDYTGFDLRTVKNIDVNQCQTVRRSTPV